MGALLLLIVGVVVLWPLLVIVFSWLFGPVLGAIMYAAGFAVIVLQMKLFYVPIYMWLIAATFGYAHYDTWKRKNTSPRRRH